jgi:glutamyl-tRNA reductase
MAKLTGVHLQAQQVKQLTIASRTLSTAEQLAAHIGGRAVPWASLGDALSHADIVITATGAASPILTKAHLETIMRPRRNRPLFIIDIAMPRDVEAAAGEIEQVFLYNIDDLQATVRENLARRASEVTRAEAIVGEEVEKFGRWIRSRGAIPTVVALRQRFENIRRAEIDRLASTLPPDARARVDDITRLVVEKLLLTPTEQLKSLNDPDTVGTYAEALRRLFALDTRSSPTDAAAESDEERRGRDRRVEPFVRPRSR